MDFFTVDINKLCLVDFSDSNLFHIGEAFGDDFNNRKHFTCASFEGSQTVSDVISVSRRKIEKI